MAEAPPDQATLWKPSDFAQITAVVTGCLCLVILVAGIILLLATGTISAKDLGETTSIGVGSGLVGLAAVIAWVIKVALPKRGA